MNLEHYHEPVQVSTHLKSTQRSIPYPTLPHEPKSQQSILFSENSSQDFECNA
jgi:hypothetical protein